YWKRTNDLLLTVPVDVAKYGVSSQLQNVGNVENRGIEASLSGKLIDRRELRWTASANVAYNHNELTSLGNNDKLNTASYALLKKGEAVGSFYGLLFDGVVQTGEDTSILPSQNGSKPTAGEAKFRDVNGDNKIDANDRVILGHAQPDLTFGLQSSLTWRQFDAFIQFAGQTGGHVYNSLRRTLEHPTDCYNVASAVLDSWTPTNPSIELPKISDVRPYSYIDSRYVEKSDYLKLRTLSIGYHFKVKPVKADLRLSATASNLLTLTGYKGYDPEVQGGVDLGQYPTARTFTFGAELVF
ncbi:MAG: TonB-dependent receptor, partial [Prevotella sp.]|nr:TonB-dependent receptor [Prevotella sp.]